MIDEKKVEKHYSQGSIIDLILGGIKSMGKTIKNINIDDLALVDEFHIGGLEATKNFINKLAIDPSHHILDIGCGGGLLCEPLSRLGAEMTGIDPSNDSIEVAKLHSKEMNLNIKYIHCSPENLNFKNEFDVILNMEVVEHVSNVSLFMQNCSKLIKKNGIMFVATINKNLKSYIFAILGAEYILRWLPIGTHDWDKFLTPQDLDIIARKNNFLADEIVGMKFNLFSDKWSKSNDTSVNYISTFFKN